MLTLWEVRDAYFDKSGIIVKPKQLSSYSVNKAMADISARSRVFRFSRNVFCSKGFPSLFKSFWFNTSMATAPTKSIYAFL